MRLPLVRSAVVAALLVAVALTGGGSVAERPVAPVATTLYRDATGVLTCGVVTCSYYFDRRSTRTIADVVGRHEGAINGGAAGLVGVACAATGAGAIASAFCTTAGGVAAGAYLDQVKAARSADGCLRLLNNTAQFAPYIISIAPTLLTPVGAVVVPATLPGVVAAGAGSTIPLVDDSGFCENG
jgi:hypothetical protein